MHMFMFITQKNPPFYTLSVMFLFGQKYVQYFLKRPNELYKMSRAEKKVQNELYRLGVTKKNLTFKLDKPMEP